MTLEAWVRPAVAGGWRTVLVKEQPGQPRLRDLRQHDSNRPDRRGLRRRVDSSIQGPAALPTLAWSHLAATYDGATLRLYVNGAQVAQLAITGSILTSNSPRPDRRQRDLGRVLQRPDRRSPRLQPRAQRGRDPGRHEPERDSRHDAADRDGEDAGARTRQASTSARSATATFSEPMNPGSITTLDVPAQGPGARRRPGDRLVRRGDEHRDADAAGALQYGATYTVTVKGGAGGVTDLAATRSPPTRAGRSRPRRRRRRSSSSARPRTRSASYLGEILRNEGLNAFTTIDVAFVSPALLAQFDVVVLGDTPLNAAQVSALTGWVNAGGNLIAMRPDKQLAGLLGLTDAGTTLANAYLQVDTSSGAGSRDRRQHDPVPRHRRPLHAERRDRGRDALLERDDGDREPRGDPALGRRERRPGGRVHLRPRPLRRLHAPGQSGLGRAGARRRRRGSAPTTSSTAPAPATCSRTGSTRTRSRSRRPTSSSGCSLNLITLMERDKMPLPRFWYLPRGEKAVVVMSGDDHSPSQAPGGTASNFDRFKSLSPPGCVVANWDCVRSTSLRLPQRVAHAMRRRPRYLAEGFEVALHPLVGSCPTAPITAGGARPRSSTRSSRSSRAKYTSLPRPSRAAPTASTGRTGPRTRRSSSRAESGWTPTTTTTPAPGSARSPAS